MVLFCCLQPVEETSAPLNFCSLLSLSLSFLPCLVFCCCCCCSCFCTHAHAGHLEQDTYTEHTQKTSKTKKKSTQVKKQAAFEEEDTRTAPLGRLVLYMCPCPSACPPALDSSASCAGCAAYRVSTVCACVCVCVDCTLAYSRSKSLESCLGTMSRSSACRLRTVFLIEKIWNFKRRICVSCFSREHVLSPAAVIGVDPVISFLVWSVRVLIVPLFSLNSL